MTLEELKQKLKDSTDEDEKVKLKADIKKIEEDNAKKAKDGDQSVSYYKFQRLEDKNAELLGKLEAIQEKDKDKADKALKEQGKFKELVDKKDVEIKTLKDQIKGMEDKRKTESVDNMLLKIINDNSPQDPSDVLSQIDRSKLDIKDEDGKLVVNGLDNQITDIKKGKPWLFKSGKDDNKDDDENKGIKVEGEELTSRFRELHSKDSLTMQEQQEMNSIAMKMQKQQKDKQKDK